MQRVSSANRKTLILQLDYEPETTKVPFDRIYALLPRFADPPCQALPLCQLEGIDDAQMKNKILKPYMQEDLRLKVGNSIVFTSVWLVMSAGFTAIFIFNALQVKSFDGGVYTVNMYWKDEELKPPPGIFFTEFG